MSRVTTAEQRRRAEFYSRRRRRTCVGIGYMAANGAKSFARAFALVRAVSLFELRRVYISKGGRRDRGGETVIHFNAPRARNSVKNTHRVLFRVVRRIRSARIRDTLLKRRRTARRFSRPCNAISEKNRSFNVVSQERDESGFAVFARLALGRTLQSSRDNIFHKCRALASPVGAIDYSTII